MGARDAGVVYLLIVIAHLCTCARYINRVNYKEHQLESDKICHIHNKKQTLDMRPGIGAIVTPHYMFDRWTNVKTDRECSFEFKTSKAEGEGREGVFAVIQKMYLRRDGDRCIDYVQFQRSDGHWTSKFCGELDRSQATYLPVPEPEDNSGNTSWPRSSNFMYAEYDPIPVKRRDAPWRWTTDSAKIGTKIFISKESVPDGQSLDLTIVYTPYKRCDQADFDYKPVGYNNCIRKEYICDKIYNCPLGVCSDEANCTVNDRYPKDDTATKVTVGAVTTMILCFIIFVMCLWICKKSQKLCWSSDCAGPNACSRPVSLPDADGIQGSNRGVPTAPMLEVAVSSPVADKDLPPSYDSLFPEQSSPARS
ncbi:PREDICTED: uncharacterized protein LOC105458231 [Wasmannia auropunctata]|uniref:uncharacterized protein LOC105458231 n=1 Tax=Wasmannia auropunctata TaxID=64793 RepID=UPI0005ED5386|nr:PREDICTED: uncharacterized protein LOC105458231 [Wasmannia auropunctata]